MKKLYFTIRCIIALVFCMNAVMYSQCDINAFTLTPINGSCAQDGKITVDVPGGTSCGSATATIRKKGATTDDTFISLSASGTGQFNNLAPGEYEIKLQQSTFTTPYKSVTVTSSYTPIKVTATPTNTTCSNTDPLFTNNGSIKVDFSGGNGPFTVTLTGPGGPYTYNTPTAGSHTFNNLAPGNYIATVTDNSSSCTSAEARSASITETVYPEMKHGVTRRVVHTNCQLYFRFEFINGNKEASKLPGNATYTIEGDPNVYNLILVSMGATGNWVWRTEYGIPANKNITWVVSDGCTKLSRTVDSGALEEPWTTRELKETTNANCETVFSFQYRPFRSAPNDTYYWSLSNSGGRVSYYAEVPVNSDNWVLFEDKRQDTGLYLHATWQEVQTTYIQTRIKVVFTDNNGCNSYERIVDGRGVPSDNNLNKIRLDEIPGILEGTSSISVSKNATLWWATSDSFSYPVTFTIERKDGQKDMTVNASQPYNLAGSYNIKFPYVYSYTAPSTTHWSYDGPIFGDLPLGEYIMTIKDACGYTVTREINLTKPAQYNPSIKFNVGCAASDVIYSMGINNNVQDVSRVSIYKNNNGVIGSLVAGYNPNKKLEGVFNTITPGDYFLVYDYINYTPRDIMGLVQHSSISTRSVARDVPGVNQKYQVAFTVDPYKQLSFGTSSLFCDPTDANSGILAISTSGIPVGKITYSIWKGNLDPNTATPTQTYTTTNLSEMEHVFTNLSAGDYFVRVINDCGFTEQKVTLIPGSAVYPDPVAVPGTICKGKDEKATLAIALPSSLFDIEWFDNNNISIGIGSSIDVQPNTTTTYKVVYKIKPSFGCTSVAGNSATIKVEVEDCFCYKPAATSGTTLETKHGITSLSRASDNSNDWPRVRGGAWTVLEAKTKGFVINRIPTTAEVNALANPIEGMMVFDIEANCLKVYTSSDKGSTYAWQCLTQQACPDN